MKICHIALYTRDLERLRGFYERYFGGVSNQKYHNPAKGFSSYFLRFGPGVDLELMTMEAGLAVLPKPDFPVGYAHMAFSAVSEQGVDELTQRLRHDGFTVLSGPRHTGDGHYESCVLDPDGNRVEITAEG